MTPIALIDANVLWSAMLCDTLLRAAEGDLYRPAWTMEILRELAINLKARRGDIDPGRIDRRIEFMRQQFPEALITGYHSLVPEMRNDEKDRHVLAAAIYSGATVIVTFNKRHFPEEICGPFNIDVQSPDEFLTSLWSQNTEAIALILRQQVEDLKNPPVTLSEIIEKLGSYTPNFANLVRNSGLL